MTSGRNKQARTGEFSSWLRHVRHSLLDENGIDVPCGDCVACCSSSQFIHIRPEETGTLSLIRKDLLVSAPGLPDGNMLLGYDKNGNCPMLRDGMCSIYDRRPLTCRNYDCRIFAAAGITAGEEVASIAEQAKRWEFSYPTQRDREEHRAVQAAARFIRDHAANFPGGKIPGSPGELAIVAIKAYRVFLNEAGSSEAGRILSDFDMADAIVLACREFDALSL